MKATAVPTMSKMTPREHIDTIRSVQAPPDANCTKIERARDAHLRGLAEGYLKQIAEQLYSSDAHFALELLQNADDNSYDADCDPQFEVIVEANRLTIKNNEQGFLPPHVDSICTAGSSTKVLDKPERIGEKGIGFKSVFLVSDAPEVHSNGYHFRFDRSVNDPSSLIRPVWIDKPIFEGAGTAIVIPVKTGKSVEAAVGGFMLPENLLFLRRIRRIVIDNRVIGHRTELSRQDEGSVTVVTSTCGPTNRSTTVRFFTHRESTSMEGVEEKLRPGVCSSEVVIALPLGGDGTFDESKSRSLYAFLPVKQSGLKFVAHADFVLTANREGVREDLPWNIRLRDQLGAALANALLAAKLTDAGRTALRFVIHVDQVTDVFLQPVMRIATGRLRESLCIPCEALGWASPKSALRHDRGSLIAGLLHDDAGCRILACQFVDADIRRIDSALELLGCRQCDLGSLKQCLVTQEFVKGKAPRWFGLLLVAIGGLQEPLRADFKSLPVLLLKSGEATGAAEGIYTRGKGRTSDYGFESKLKFLHEGVLHDLDNDKRSTALLLLKEWRIGPLMPHTIIDGLILRLHDNSDSRIDEQEAVGHVRYVRDHFHEYLKGIHVTEKREEARRAIAATLRIRVAGLPASQSWVGYARIDALYLTSPYCSESLLREVLGSDLDRLCISDLYVGGATLTEQEADRKKWFEFFDALGAHRLPRVLSDEWNNGWRASPEVLKVIDSTDEKRKLALLQVIADQWDEYSFKISLGSNGSAKTDFGTALRAMKLSDSKGRSVAIRDSQRDCDDIREVFGESARCIKFEWKNADFLKRLGVAESPTVPEVLRRLRENSSHPVSPRGERVAPMRLYEFLSTHFKSAEVVIKAAFENEKLILCQREGKPDWKALGEVVWSLEPVFRPFTSMGVLAVESLDGLKDFFVSRLGVSAELKARDWVATLTAVSKDRRLEPATRASHALEIYRKLERFVSDNGSHDEGWLNELKRQKCILTKAHGWQQPCSNLMIPDDEVLCGAFEDSSKIWFIDVPLAELPRMQELFSSLNLTPISKAVKLVLVESTTSERSDHRAATLRDRWPELMRYVYHKHQQLYREHVKSGLLTRIQNATLYHCDEVRLDASCAGERRQVSRSAWLEVHDNLAKIWEAKAASKSWWSISLELARVLKLKPELAALLNELLSSASPSATLGDLKVGELPEDEANRWGTSGDSINSDVTFEKFSTRADAASSDFEVDSDSTLPATATNQFAPATADGSVHAENSTKSSDVLSSIDREHREADFKGEVTTYNNTKTSTAECTELGASPRQAASTSDRGTEHKFAKSDRLISYLEPLKGSDEDSGGKEQKLQIAKAAVEVAMSSEREHDRVPTEMSHLNAGYDIESRSGRGGLERHIEVKGLRGLWETRGVTMSRTQFEFARDNGDTSWLYVVESALEPLQRKLYRIKNPALRFTEFGIDSGWKSFAE